ncbi:MAG: DnaJ domain-containing protein [Acidobacteriota bacterium]
MEATTKIQRRRVQRKPADRSVIRIELKDHKGNARLATADLVDVSDGGFGLSLMTPLKPGATVVVRGKLGEYGVADGLRANVRWCVEKPDGTYQAGFDFMDSRQAPPAEEKPSETVDPDAFDCYEAMQLSPNADADTIARVYRLLALRYHPDNNETGNREVFLRLSEAHQILSDPEKRARYDVLHRHAKRLHWKIFDQASSATGTEGEKRKRQGIIALLYSRMLHDPEQPEMTIQLLEELLGCPREHLQAAIWYLKGKNFIRRADNGRYSITVAGFEEAESQNFTPVDRPLLASPQAD